MWLWLTITINLLCLGCVIGSDNEFGVDVDAEIIVQSLNETRQNIFRSILQTVQNHQAITTSPRLRKKCYVVGQTQAIRSSRCVRLENEKIRSCTKQEKEDSTEIIEKIMNDFGFRYLFFDGETLRKSDIIWASISLMQTEKHDLVDQNFTSLIYPQRINRLPAAASDLNRKDNFALHYKNAQLRYGKEHFDFHPVTYIIPQDLDTLMSDSRSTDSTGKWIAKPVFGGQGIGIMILQTSTLDQLSHKGDYLVQQYIHNPFLINKHKHTLRLYTLISSIHPLRVYLYNNGIVKFASNEFSDDVNHFTTDEKFRHITNQALNINNPSFTTLRTDAEAVFEGSRWNIKGWKQYMASQGHNITLLWKRIKDTVLKSVLAVESKIYNESLRLGIERGVAFQLLGTDIDVDTNLKPWFIESNVNPTLNSNVPFERRDKFHMLTDAFNMLGLDTDEYNKNVKLVEEDLKEKTNQLSDEEIRIIAESEYENLVKGEWERLFPSEDLDENDYYSNFIDLDNREFTRLLLNYEKTKNK